MLQSFRIKTNLKTVLNSLRKSAAESIPSAISKYEGEREILRTSTLLVTDVRLVYIDAYDRTLKTYLFEHMISINKRFYQPTPFNAAFCKILVTLAFLILLITFILDLFSPDSQGFLMVYIPVLLSMLTGIMVWCDMRPNYSVEWTMRNGDSGQIKSEPMLREWLAGNNSRENFMLKLTNAMNEALSRSAWWPSHANAGSHLENQPTPPTDQAVQKTTDTQRPKLKLANSLYE